ncbi:iron-siderophore ABC transporter substrate-binding protein [Streptomyces sp. HNM0574]|uniref:ABC transporter substrate-binding protein n=1 Tax=Streptomyces sp. HNM0574 TaxID=2714954 RepID=UPI00146D39C5|nr:iron-siderophore ABC transporter substrate-binding protein [Streptomyces sp. HNM0574]NLU68948.1 iron-siderophore ABC transporter substrate-binding protein [Streptomyces sp. HNM0574]
MKGAHVTRSARGRTATLTALALSAALGLSACGTGGGGESKNAEKRTHPVKTAKGTVSVPDAPERVVVLDTGELDSAITLGVKPVGATKADVGKALPGYLPKDKVEGIENVGTIGQPNLEKIASLKPDLILTSALRDEANYEELKAIAPTVMTEATGYPWKQNFRVHADALGKKAEGEKVVADYEKHAAEVTEALGGRKKAKELKTNVIRFTEGSDTRIYGDKSYIGTVLKDVGLGRPPIVKKAKEADGLYVGVSPERIDEADADVLFHSSYGDPDKSGYSKAVKSDLWKDVRAVRDGKAFAVDDDRWFLGIGYTSAHQILDDISKNLAG